MAYQPELMRPELQRDNGNRNGLNIQQPGRVTGEMVFSMTRKTPSITVNLSAWVTFCQLLVWALLSLFRGQENWREGWGMRLSTLPYKPVPGL